MHRVAILLVVAFACESGSSTNGGGSATPGSAAVKPAPPPTPPPPPPPPPPRAGPPVTISSKGLSSLGRYEWWHYDDQQTLALLRERIVLPGATVSIVSKDIDRPEYAKYTMVYWSVRRGDQELVQVLRDEGGAPEGPRPVQVIVLSPDVPTDDGIKVGDKASAIFAKHSNIRCWVYVEPRIAPTIMSRRACAEFPGGELRYVLAERGPELRVGEVALARVAKLPIIALVHQPYDD